MTDRDDEPTIDELNDEADIAADYLEGLLDALDFDGDIEMGVRDGRPVVQIVADDDTDIRALIGRDGEVVEALQRLTRLAVQEKAGVRSRLILDVDGFLSRRRRRLREEALDAIDEVNETGEPVTLEDMNSYERKIVHDVARDEGMRSRSHGEEPHRHVTIYLSKADRDALRAEAEDDDDADLDDESQEPNEAVDEEPMSPDEYVDSDDDGDDPEDPDISDDDDSADGSDEDDLDEEDPGDESDDDYGDDSDDDTDDDGDAEDESDEDDEDDETEDDDSDDDE